MDITKYRCPKVGQKILEPQVEWNGKDINGMQTVI